MGEAEDFQKRDIDQFAGTQAQAIQKGVDRFVQEHGAVPPPWVAYPDTHPYDMFWRMGDGETHVMVFNEWWEQEMSDKDESVRIEYFRKWPPPARWLAWMIDAVWGFFVETHSTDPEVAPYFQKLEALGFGTAEAYEQDMDNPKWLQE